MSYRYARSNGQFLESKFVDPVADATSQNFRCDQSYSLLNTFVSGASDKNSFVSNTKQGAYTHTSGSLLAWWRLNTNIATTGNGIDSSGYSRPLAPPSDPADRPSFDDGVSPSTSFIQKATCLFNGTKVLEASDSSSFSFGNAAGNGDKPFSVSCRVKFTSLGSQEILVAKYDASNTSKQEWRIYKSTSNAIRFDLRDGPISAGYAVRTSKSGSTPISAGVWYHIVATYTPNYLSFGVTNAAFASMRLYINGIEVNDIAGSGVPYQDSSYGGMIPTAAKVSVGGSDDEHASFVFSGNICDVAIWDRAIDNRSDVPTGVVWPVLNSPPIKALYSAQVYGAYLLVRDFSKESIDNDTRVIGIQSERKGLSTSDLPFDIMDQFKQGINVKTHKQLSEYNGFKIRPNSSFINTLNGKDVPTTTFNDELSPTSFASGKYAAASAKLSDTAWYPGSILEITDARGSKINVNADNTITLGNAAQVSATTNEEPGLYKIGLSGSAATVAKITEGLHNVIQLAQSKNDIQIESSYNSVTETTHLKQLYVGISGNRIISGSAVTDGFWSTTGFTGGSGGANTSFITLGGAGKLSSRLSHEMEQRDLGQFSFYDSAGAFEDTSDLNPIAIVTRSPFDLVLPYQMVSQKSNEIFDGVIEPLIIRPKIDRSTIEGPFYAHDIRSSLGGMTDPFRRSYVIVDGHDLDEPDKGCAPFLDSNEQFGTLDLPGAFSDNFATIEPFVDYLNDRDKEYTTNGVSTTIANVLINSGSWVDNDDRTYDKMAAHGFVFDNDPIGLDSIAYGGLKK